MAGGGAFGYFGAARARSPGETIPVTYVKPPHCLITASVALSAPIDTMMADLGHAFTRRGVFTRTLLHTDAFPNHRFAQAMVGVVNEYDGPGFILNLNAKDAFVATLEDGSSVSVHDAWDLPLVSFMVDPPAVHEDYLRAAPENAVITFIDEGHLDYFDAAGFPSRTRIFCPHGGPDPIPDPLGAEDREIDLLFSGTVVAPASLADWLDRLADGDSGRRKALETAHEAVADGGEDVFAALDTAFDGTPADMATLVGKLDTFVSQTRRLDVLAAIRGNRVTICGPVAPEAGERLAHHDLRGDTRFGEVLELMANAKVVINSRVTFGRGAHERLFYAMSRGAVVATEPSAFMATEIDNAEGLFALPRGADDIDDTIGGMLADPAAIDEMRDRGRPVYVEKHTWNERAGRILAALGRHGI